MIGVLVAFNPHQSIGWERLVRLLFFELVHLGHPGYAAFNPNLFFGLDLFGLV